MIGKACLSLLIILISFTIFFVRQPIDFNEQNYGVPQTQIKKSGMLLNETGQLAEVGWSKGTLKTFEENNITFIPYVKCLDFLRIKKWETTNIINEDFLFQILYGNIGYTTIFSLRFVDFKSKKITVKSYQPFDIRLQKYLNLTEDALYGKPELESNHTGFRIKIKSDKISCKSLLEKRIRVETIEPNMQGEFTIQRSLYSEPFTEISPLSKDKTKFIYSLYEFNQKIEGRFKVDDKWYYINNSTIPTLAISEVIRAHTPYKTSWVIAMGQGFNKEDKIGINLGGGYAEPTVSEASRDSFYLNDKVYKINSTKTTIDLDGISTFNTVAFENNGDCEISFQPIKELTETINNHFLYLASQEVTRYYGKFEGSVILKDNEYYNFKNVYGYIEIAKNKW